MHEFTEGTLHLLSVLRANRACALLSLQLSICIHSKRVWLKYSYSYVQLSLLQSYFDLPFIPLSFFFLTIIIIASVADIRCRYEGLLLQHIETVVSWQTIAYLGL